MFNIELILSSKKAMASLINFEAMTSPSRIERSLQEPERNKSSIFRTLAKRSRFLSKVVSSKPPPVPVSPSIARPNLSLCEIAFSRKKDSKPSPHSSIHHVINRGLMSRDVMGRRSFEVRKDRKQFEDRLTPQCRRSNTLKGGTPSHYPTRGRIKSSIVDNRVLSSDEDEDLFKVPGVFLDETLEEDVFPEVVFPLPAPKKPLARSHTHPKKKTKSVSSGCISTESGYGTMTRKGTTLRPAEPEDEDVFSYSRGRIGTGFSLSDDCVYVEALWDHVTMDNEELGFKVGDVIRVIDTSNSDWWWGEMDANEGWFPATFVRVLVNQQLCEGSENGDVISSSLDAKNDDTYSIVSHEFTRVTSFSNELCECMDRPVQTSATCALCGLPIKGLETESEAKLDASHRLQPEIVVTVPANPPRKSSITREQIRINVIKEIVSSEKVFVGHLKDVIEGYLTRCRKREDMFTEQQIKSIFGNIEEIYTFQQGFSEQLCKSMNTSCIPDTRLGNVFLRAKEGFTIYSEYCNNHPQALAQLSQMLTVKKYVRYFEACRLLQKMIDIPLDGFLLTPVQKICKYPLQLAELLKYTSPDHPDYEPVKEALEAMKNVAHMINERKRRMENVKKISMWQSTIINWQGEDVLLRSTELIHSSDIYAISEMKTKPKPRIAFLFDHQLILCKKDILRKDLLYYKSRVDLDKCDLVPMENDSPRSSTFADNWSSASSASSQCGWKCIDRNTGIVSVMYCKNANDCMKWMEAFDKANEIAKTRSTSMNEHEMAITQDIIRKQLNSSHEKPNKDGPTRINSTYRYRMKMVHQNGHHEINKSKLIVNPPEKSGGFFSNMTGKLTPFRRSVNSHHQRETNFVF